MAKLYGEIAAKALLTLDKSFARANGQPLDASEVYYSLQAAKDYAATAQAYVGQKIVVIENGIVSHYSVEDTAGNLKELGSKPVADGTTVAIDADGKITLANITEAEKTGTYNAVLNNGVLTWIKPSSTTVEGLNDLIIALTSRVETAESDIDALQAAVGVAAKDAVGEEGSEGYEPAVVATGLHKAIADEAARAKAAEEALGGRIDAIDFVDNDELNEAIKDFATKTYVAEEIAKVEVPVTGIAADDKVLSVTDKVISATVGMSYDSNNKKIVLSGKDGIELGTVDATPFIKDGMLSDVDYNADNNTLTFTWNTDSGEKTDTVVLSDIIEPYTAGDGLDLTGNEFSIKLADGSETFLSVSSDGLKLAGITTAIGTAKSEAIADAEGKIATAKQEAIDAAAVDATSKANQALEDAKTNAASLYATKEYVGAFTTGEDNYKDLDTVVAYINKKAEETLAAAQGGSSETAASVALALQNYKNENDPKVSKNINDIAAINEKLATIDTDADVNVIETVKVNGTALTPDENKAIDIKVLTKFSEITDDSGFDSRITAAQSQADKGVNDAAAAQTKANEAAQAAENNASALGELSTTVAGHTTTIGEHTIKITALENADSAHSAEYNALKAIVEGHTTAIASKAESTSLEAAKGDIQKNTNAISVLNETTIPNINTEIGKKANAANVYTKTEVDAITGTLAEGKNLVQMIEDAQSNATYDDTQIKSDIKANADAIAVLNSDADTEGSVLNVAKAEAESAAKAEVSILVGSAPEALDTLEEIAKWISNDNSGTTALIDRVTANENAIAAINNSETGLLAQAKAYTEAQIEAIPTGSASAAGLVKVDDVTIQANDGSISVKAISTDLLTQGTQELILNGGSAV